MRKKAAKKPEKVDTVEKLAILMVGEFDRIDERFERVETRIGSLEREVRDGFASLRAEVASVRHELEHLRGRVESTSGFAKEIDHALERIRRIEARIGLDQ